MANTVFFKKAYDNASEITWKDVFSDFRRQHDRQDFDYALLAGTSIDSATEADMIDKWEKPWIFYPILKGGVVLIILIYLLFFSTLYFSDGMSTALYIMTAMIPPLVMPIVLLVLIWEMNIPRNISIYGVAGYFVVGGLLSFFATSFLFSVVPDVLPPSFAAFREEPAKLIVIAILLWFFGRNNKIYGITGLVIGAAVGAGFGAFESIEYAMSDSNVYSLVINQIFRGVFALGGHTLYCAPYAAELALGMREHRMSGKAFFRGQFIMAFIISCGFHFLWNLSLGSLELPKDIVIIILLWAILLMTIRKCLNQIAEIGLHAREKKDYEEHLEKYEREISYRELNIGDGPGVEPEKELSKTMYETPMERVKSLEISCIKGDLLGEKRVIRSGDTISVGRSPDCGFRFSADSKGVSRKHCRIQYGTDGCTIVDEGSSFGTYINTGGRIPPNQQVRLNDKDVIYLGGRDNVLQVKL